jgi:cellobiose transport system permease protein
MSMSTTADDATASTGRRPVGVRSRGRQRSPIHGRSGYGFIAPFFVTFLSFSFFPFIYTAWVSLHVVSLTNINHSTWAGLGNFTALLHNPRFWLALRNTIAIGVIGTIPQLAIALGLAHLLNYKLRGRTFFRVAMLTPYATSIAAATLIFAQIFARNYGIIDVIVKAFGGHSIDFESGIWTSKIAIGTIVIWRWTGYTALIYLASMQAIPQDLYEAASIDGSNRWQDFRYVTLPSLRPTINFTIIASTIGALQIFGEPLLFGGQEQLAGGGSVHQYQTLGLLMYDQGWQNFHIGQAAATAWAMFLIIVFAVGAFSLLTWWLHRGDQ